MDILTLIVEIEHEFNITIDNNETSALKTVNDLVLLVVNKLNPVEENLSNADKEKLLLYAKALVETAVPELQSEKAKGLLKDIVGTLADFTNSFSEEIKAL